MRLATLLAVVLLAAAPASAQSTDVQGTVTGASGPIRLARVVAQAGDATGDTLGVAFTDLSGRFEITVAGTPADDRPAATDYAVGDAYPNPSPGSRVTIPYTTPGDRPERAEVEAFDLLGREIPVDTPLGAGTYLYRLRFANGTVSRTRKLVAAQSGGRIVAEQTRGTLPGARAPRAALRMSASSVFLTVERAGFVTDTRTVETPTTLAITLDAAARPTARIATPASVQAGTAITLDGSTSTGANGETLRYTWDFGDGTRGGNGRVAHVYTEPGTYTVELTVQGAFGATQSTTASVTVTDPPAAAGTAPVRVVVTGTTGALVVGATTRVVGGTASATTGDDGVAVIESVPTGIDVAIAVELPGFATQRLALRLPAAAGDTTSIDVTLGARQPAVTLRRVEEGGDVRGTEGVRVELPVEGLVHADGTPAAGDIDVMLTPVDVSDDDEIGAFPGAFAGVTPDGPAEIMLSYGTAEYVFEQDGEELDLAPGKTATIEIPFYIGTEGDGSDIELGDTQPLWSLDETTGEWVLEGEGVVVASASSPTGFALRAEVSHFSWWNIDIAPDPYTPIPECEVTNEGGLPTLQLDETCYIDGYIADQNGPRTRPNTTIGPNNTRPLPVPPGIDIGLTGCARGGTLCGETTVNGEAGATGSITITLRPVDLSAGGSIAPDTTLSGLIESPSETDTFTFAATAGRYVSVEVQAGQASPLVGTVLITTPGNQEIASSAFNGSRAGRVAFIAPTTGVYTITVDGTRNEPGVYDLRLIERAPRQLAAGPIVPSAIAEEGDEKAFAFTVTPGTYARLTVGRPADSRLNARVTLYGPDGLEAQTSVLSSRTVGLALPAGASGDYVAVVDGQLNEPADFSIRFVERTPRPVSLGTEQSEAVGELGDRFAYAFEGTAGQPVDLYLARGDLFSGKAEVFGPDGARVNTFGLNTSAFVDVETTGTYTVVVDALDGPSDLVTAFRAVPALALDTEVSGTLRQGERWNYLVTPTADTFVRAGIASDNVSASAFLFPLDRAPQTARAFGISAVGAGRYRLEALTSSAGTHPFRAALAVIEAPTPLTFDGAGRATVASSLDLVGDLALYRIDTAAGSGLMTRLTASGASPLGTSAIVVASPLQAGQTIPDGNRTVDGFDVSDRNRASDGATPAGLLEAYGARLPDGVGYVIAVASEPNYRFSDQGDTPTGTFTLEADVVAPNATIEVDDDLAQCASAATRSLHAALFAAPEGATVTACAGRYAESIGLPVLNGVTLEGTDRDAVVLAHDVELVNVNPVVINGSKSGSDAGFTLRDVTIETIAAAMLMRGDDLVVERVTIRPEDGFTDTIQGIQTSGANARIEDVRVESAQFGVNASGSDGLQIVGSTFTGTPAFALVNVSSSESVTIENNTFEPSDGGAIRVQTSSNGGHRVEGNTITVGDAGTRTAQGGVLAVAVGTSSAESVVRGNVIELADKSDAAIYLDSRDNARLVAEANEVRVSDPEGAASVTAFAQRGGAIVVRNNVFDGSRSFRSVDLFSTADASVAFVNNSVRVAAGANTSASAELVTARSNAAGALPITIVNNVLEGIGSTGISTPSGYTVTADHNLLFGFVTPYGGDASGGSGDVIGQDPQFTGSRLDVASGSPAVNAGASSTAFPDVPATDIDGTARPQGGAVDIGAHEQ